MKVFVQYAAYHCATCGKPLQFDLDRLITEEDIREWNDQLQSGEPKFVARCVNQQCKQADKSMYVPLVAIECKEKT